MIRFSSLLVVLFCLLLPNILFASKASPDVHQLIQPDGSVVAARQWGDEYLHGWESLEGYTILQGHDGFWVYADINVDGALVPTYIPANNPQPFGLSKSLRPVPDPASLALSLSIEEPSRVMSSMGTINIPIVLINFSDTAATYTNADFTSLFFESDPSIATGPGSARDYFEEVSYGAFSISPGSSGVSGWHTAIYGHDYYNTHTLDLFKEAVLAADAGGMDFTQYDNDNDGKVDTVIIVHQGRSESESGNPTDIWSHRSSTTGNFITIDGMAMDNYVMVPERRQSTIATIGTFAHELGHSLGLPDLYDTDYSSAGIGDWGLMSGGSWNRTVNSGDTPAHPCAWSKYFLGWVTPLQVNGSLVDEPIDQASENQDVYMLLDNPGGADWPTGTGEYFLIENRQQTNFDAGLKGNGLLIWHVWEEAPSSLSAANQNEGGPKLVDLEEADGLAELDSYWWEDGDSGDPFPGISDNRAFIDDSNPDARYYDGGESKTQVLNISDSGTTMTASMCVGDPDPCPRNWYRDQDGDGYSDGVTSFQVDRPGGYFLESELTEISGDCNDNNATVNPGGVEVPGNGLDDDCDPSTKDKTDGGGGGGCNIAGPAPGDSLWPDIFWIALMAAVLLLRKRGLNRI